MKIFFTGRNEVVAKVMFLLVSVILSTGGGPGKETPLGRRPPTARSPPAGRPPWQGGPPGRDSPQQGAPQQGTPLVRRPPLPPYGQ